MGLKVKLVRDVDFGLLYNGDNMNDAQIKCFITVADKKSFTGAALELYISQPNISRSIAAFEQELGVTLFDRTNKYVKLTEAGELYYDYFKRFQLELQQVNKKAKLLNYNRQGNIRLGYIEGWNISTFMPQILKKFSQEYPGIDISIECYSFNELLKKLMLDELDVILTLDFSLNNISSIKRKSITEIQRLILYPDFHELAHKDNLTPYDFRNETFYVMSNEELVNLDQEIREYCEPYGFVPKVKYVHNTESMLASVQNGLGVAIYDVWGRNISTGGFKHILINSFHKVSMAWSVNTTNVAASVLINEVYFMIKNKDLYQK